MAVKENVWLQLCSMAYLPEFTIRQMVLSNHVIQGSPKIPAIFSRVVLKYNPTMLSKTGLKYYLTMLSSLVFKVLFNHIQGSLKVLSYHVI